MSSVELSAKGRQGSKLTYQRLSDGLISFNSVQFMSHVKVMLRLAVPWVQKFEKECEFNTKTGKIKINPLLFQLKV